MSPLSFEFVSATFAPSAIVSVPAVRLPPSMSHAPEALSAASTVSASPLPITRPPIVSVSPPEILALAALTTTLSSVTSAPVSETFPPFSANLPSPVRLPSSFAETFSLTETVWPAPIVAPSLPTFSVPEFIVTSVFSVALFSVMLLLFAPTVVMMASKPSIVVFVALNSELPVRLTDLPPLKATFSSVRFALSKLTPEATETSKAWSSVLVAETSVPCKFIMPRTSTFE